MTMTWGKSVLIDRGSKKFPFSHLALINSLGIFVFSIYAWQCMAENVRSAVADVIGMVRVMCRS